GNAADGVLVSAAANSNTIGGTVSGAENVICNNGGGGFNGTSGVEIGGSSNVVAGNFIGVAADGTTAVGNFGDGVLVNSGADNTIGGTVAAAENVIAYNGTRPAGCYGLDILGGNGTFYDYNYIGYDEFGNLSRNKTGGVNHG